jgi:hypothetical protein
MTSKVRITILLTLAILFTSSYLFGQTNLPLAGQYWVFTNGANEESHIVKSLADFSPSKVIVAWFRSPTIATVRYANMAGVFCRSTAEALDSISAQLKNNPELQVQVNASLRTFPDTAYSCDDALKKLSNGGRFSRFVINDAEVSPSSSETDWHWSFAEPTCYASRAATSQDQHDKDLCQDGWCSDPTPDPKSPYQEACDEAYTECRHYVDESQLKSKPSTTQFWNLHIPARIVLHPKHHGTGRIMMEVSMDEAEAETMRKRARDNPDVDQYKPYLNPVFDDSASVYFSGQFLATNSAAASTWELNFDLPAPSEGASSFSHDPARAYRIRSFSDKDGLQAALLMPFAKQEDDREFLRNLDLNCPGWQYKDERIGERAFTIRNDIDATLPDVIPTNPTDERWKKVRQEKVSNPDGGYSIRTYYEDDRILNGQKAMVRNTSFPYSDYFWKGCPDLEAPPFNLTKSQLSAVLNMDIPTCNTTTLFLSPEVYGTIARTFSKPAENRERALAEKRIQEARAIFGRSINRERPTDFACPETALDLLLQRLN